MFIVTTISTPTVDDGPSGANLGANAAGDTGAFAQGDAGIGNEDTAGTTFFKTEGVVANQFTASADAAAAKDAAVVFHDQVRVGGIHGVGLPVRLQRPECHSFTIIDILKFAIAAADLSRAKWLRSLNMMVKTNERAS